MSSKPQSKKQKRRQDTRDEQGKYASYVAGTSDADELSGGFISRKVVGTSRTFWRDALATIDLSEETGGEVPKMDMLIDGKRTTQRTYSGAAGTLIHTFDFGHRYRGFGGNTLHFAKPVAVEHGVTHHQHAGGLEERN